jgi:hypothetical protein
MKASLNPSPHTRVEYDLEFSGGNYDKVGRFAYIPHSLIDKYDGDAGAAFKEATGHDPIHIIHYTVDEVYDAEGVRLDDWVPMPKVALARG